MKRHSNATWCRIELHAAPGTAELELIDGGAPEPAMVVDASHGNGLRGVRERVSALGGCVEAGPTANGGWRLWVQVPT